MVKARNPILNDVLDALSVGAVFLVMGFIVQGSNVIYPVAAFLIHLAPR